MEKDPLLLIPGPVPISPAVRSAMDAPMLSRRSAEFKAIYAEVRSGLRYVFTRSTLDGSSTADGGRPLVLNGTATMAMEAAVANLVSPDDEVLAVVNGKFGERFASIADRYASVRRVEFDWGRSIDVERVRSAVPGADLVLMVHNETSTGLANPVGAIGPTVAEHDGLFVVDGVSSIGGDVFKIDDWGVDVAITDPQKALAAPPGISAMFLSDRAIDAVSGANAPTYQNLADYLDAADDDRTPYTVASPQVRALAVALEELEAEGMPDRIARHRRRAEAVRTGVTEMGLRLFPDPIEPTTYSNTLTAVSVPAAARDATDAFFAALERRGVSVGGGLDHLAGRLIRISNMGHVADDELCAGLGAVGESFEEIGVRLDTDAGVEAARGILDRAN